VVLLEVKLAGLEVLAVAEAVLVEAAVTAMVAQVVAEQYFFTTNS
jgi:hypothetical protein